MSRNMSNQQKPKIISHITLMCTGQTSSIRKCVRKKHSYLNVYKP